MKKTAWWTNFKKKFLCQKNPKTILDLLKRYPEYNYKNYEGVTPQVLARNSIIPKCKQEILMEGMAECQLRVLALLHYGVLFSQKGKDYEGFSHLGDELGSIRIFDVETTLHILRFRCGIKATNIKKSKFGEFGESGLTLAY